MGWARVKNINRLTAKKKLLSSSLSFSLPLLNIFWFCIILNGYLSQTKPINIPNVKKKFKKIIINFPQKFTSNLSLHFNCCFFSTLVSNYIFICIVMWIQQETSYIWNVCCLELSLYMLTHFFECLPRLFVWITFFFLRSVFFGSSSMCLKSTIVCNSWQPIKDTRAVRHHFENFE